MAIDPAESPHTSAEVRARLADDLAAGKTVVLSSRELDDPALREQLPQLLEELARSHQAPSSHGLHIQGYTLLGEIGQGGMSTVYLARQETLGRHVAVKVAPKWLGGGQRAIERLVQEAQAMARVTHPNIVVIHDIIDVDDTFAIAMEWVDGRTLAGLMRVLPDEPGPDDMALLAAALGTTDDGKENFERTSVRHFVRLMYDIACATQAVHEAGLLHLDIKPSNVLVRRDGTPLLADFGVVREMTIELEHTRTFAGTPIYSAPEQLRRDDARIGPATDVYGLGITLYEALARTQPLRGLDLPGILQCVEHGRMPRLSEHLVVPADLENIVHKAIAPEVDHRYPSAAALADDLQAFLDHRPVAARPLSRSQRMRRWARNEPWKAILAAVLVVTVPALLVLGTYLVIEWPNIESARLERRMVQANQLKQAAYQRHLLGARDDAEHQRLLEEAMALDPSDSSLVCLAVMMNELGTRRATELLAAHAPAIARTLGLRLLAAKAAAGRVFFDDSERRQLAASPLWIDHYTLALDTVFWADDVKHEEAHAEAERRLAEASLAIPPDPLLLGLQAWTSLRALDDERFRAVCQVLAQRWPDDPVALAWAAIATESQNPALAREVAEHVVRVAPQHPAGYELLVGAAYRQRNDEALQREAARARAAGITSQTVEMYRLCALARTGDREAAEQALALPLPVIGDKRHFALASKFEPEAAEHWLEQTLANDRATPWELSVVFDAATRREDTALEERVWQRFRSLHGERQTLHHGRMDMLVARGEQVAAALLGREIQLPRRQLDANGPVLARLFVIGHEWQALAECAERWRQHSDGSQRRQAAFYAGLGRSRLGDPVAASALCAEALASWPESPRSWFVHALLEDAWVHSSPHAPPELRDPALAAQRLEHFEKRNSELKSPYRGPWTQLVRAAVAFANGRREQAIKLARDGLGMRATELYAPDDWREQLEAALAIFER